MTQFRSTVILNVFSVLLIFSANQFHVRGDAEDKQDSELIGSHYIVPVGHDSPSNGFGGTRLELNEMVKLPAGFNSRHTGCYFLKYLDSDNRRVRLMTTKDGDEGFSYDMTGERSDRIGPLKNPEGQEWILEPVGDQKGGGSYYLRVANGKLKGWYLTFAEKGERRKVVGGVSPKYATYWTAKLTPEPGHMSKIGFCPTPFKKMR